MAEEDKDKAPVTWGTPEMYQTKSDIVRDDSFFDLPPDKNPLSPQYTYVPTTPPVPPPGSPAANLANVGNLAGDPTMSGTGQVSLPAASPPPPQMIRDNPFGGPPIPPPPPPPNPSLQPAVPPTTPADLYTPPKTPVPTGPLPTNQYGAAQIGMLEARKQMFADQAANQARGQSEAARIQSEASAADKARTEGDPVALLKAQQDHTDALRLPDNDPNKRAKIQESEYNMRANEGSRPALLRAQLDAERRDNDIRKQIQEARAKQIDPDRWWNQKSTGSKVLAGIGMVLGGMGGGLARTGRNPAIDMMNNAISADIDSQKHDIDNQWKAIAESKGLNDTAFNRELHRQVWENNYRTASLERIKLDLAANAARTESETVKNNAQMAIQDLTNDQMKIRNNQYIVAVQAAAAETSRIRELQKQAQADVMKLVEKEGVTQEQAERSVYGSGRYADIMSRAPAHVQQEGLATQQLVGQYKADQSKYNAKVKDVEDMVKRYKLPDSRKKELIDGLGPAPSAQPQYQRLFTGERANPIGAVVGPDEGKRLDIAKKKEELQGQAGEKSAIADTYSRALAYKDYFSKEPTNPPDMTSIALGKGHPYIDNINSWNTFVDTTLAPVLERQLAGGKPGQQSLKVAHERFHISALMPLSQKTQIMQSAKDSLEEAMKTGAVSNEGIKPATIPALNAPPPGQPKIDFTPTK